MNTHRGSSSTLSNLTKYSKQSVYTRQHVWLYAGGHLPQVQRFSCGKNRPCSRLYVGHSCFHSFISDSFSVSLPAFGNLTGHLIEVQVKLPWLYAEPPGDFPHRYWGGLQQTSLQL